MNIDEILIRASATGDIMTSSRDGEITETQLKTVAELLEKRKTKPLTDNQEKELARLIDKRDNPELSETCKKRLIKVYAQEMFGRTEEIGSKYLEKGTTVEENSITLFSRVNKKSFKKNEKRLFNRFLTGLPDLYDGADAIEDAEEVIDVKSSWSLITYLNATVDKKMNHDYKWQGNSYLGLLVKAKRFRLAYCLVNTPAKLITDEKFKIARQMDLIDPSISPDYIEKCKQIERNHIFDLAQFNTDYPGFDFQSDLNEWKFDISKEKRVHQLVFDRNEAEIGQLYKRVPECRNWIRDTFLKDSPQ